MAKRAEFVLKNARRREILASFLLKSVRFGVVGVAATLVYYAVGLLGLGLGLSLFSAHWVAYFLSQSVSYMGQKLFTFGIRGRHKRAFPRYVLAVIFITLIQFGLILFLNDRGSPNHFVLIVSTLFYPPVSFIVHTFWTFSEQDHETD